MPRQTTEYGEQNRISFGQQSLNNLWDDLELLKQIGLPDECKFLLSGILNKHFSRLGGLERLQQEYQTP